MIKYIAIMAMMTALVVSQRPPYAGSGNRYPAVLPQYLTREQDRSTVASVNNRINIDEETSGESQTFYNLPVEAGGDVNLINRIQNWPRESWPFWYVNWRQLEEHRGGSQNKPDTYRPFYAGRVNGF